MLGRHAFFEASSPRVSTKRSWPIWISPAAFIDPTIPSSEARDVVLGTNIAEVPIDGVIAITAARLGMQGDPGDRFIVATALTHGATLMTADEKIRSFKSLRTLDPSR